MNSRIYCRAGLTLTVILLAVAWAHAHHGFRAFDRTKPLTLTGVVKSAEWINPHVIVYLDVKGDGGKVETWAIQTGPPNVLVRLGVTREALKPGAVFTLTGYPPRADLTDFVFAPAAAANFLRSGHMLYSYDVKVVGSDTRPKPPPLRPRGAEEHFYVLSDDRG
jgi:Family of unknown function (DUF6152)